MDGNAVGYTRSPPIYGNPQFMFLQNLERPLHLKSLILMDLGFRV